MANKHIKRTDNNIDFSITNNTKYNNVKLQGYGYEELVKKIGLPYVCISLDFEEGRHLMTLSPHPQGAHISFAKGTNNNWQISISGAVGKALYDGNYNGFRYWRLSWAALDTDIGVFHKCIIDLDDRTPKPEQLTVEPASDNDNNRLKRIEAKLDILLKEMGLDNA